MRNFLLLSAFAIDWASCSLDSRNGFQGWWPYDFFVLMLRISALERVDDSWNLLKEKLSKLNKLRWPLALADGLSKPDWCRLEFYGWPWHSALVSEHWIGRGMDFWGSEIWTIADVLMRKTSTTFLDCFVFPGRTGKHVLDIGVFKKDCFSLSDLLTLSGFEIKPWSFRNQELITWSVT
jgi:hypothetical protein